MRRTASLVEVAVARQPILAHVCLVALALALAAPRVAVAEDDADKPAPVEFGAWVEAFYSWNTNRPANDVTPHRVFDNRHNAFSLSQAGVDVTAREDAPWRGRLALWWGLTPTAIYSGEPQTLPNSGGGPSDTTVWRNLQEAWVGAKVPGKLGLRVDAGLFLSPIGLEGVRVRDNQNWSSSNLNYGLPFYHAGARARIALLQGIDLEVAVFNGAGGLIDINEGKSVSVALMGDHGEVGSWAVRYYGGDERPRGLAGAPGLPGRWLHLVDLWGTLQVTRAIWIAGQLDVGQETGTTPGVGEGGGFLAAALYVRAQITEQIGLVARGDMAQAFDQDEQASPAYGLFFPSQTMRSGTLTLDARIAEGLTVRLEGRMDVAGDPVFYGRDATTPTEDTQQTITIGMTAWR